MRRAISRASRGIEQACGYRLVYRAPPASGETTVVNAASFVNGPIAFAAPNSAGRTLAVTFSSAVAGTLTITGTVAGVAGVTEVFDAANGPVQHGVKFFSAISAAVAAGVAAPTGTVTALPSQGYVEYHTIPVTLNCDRALLRTLERPLRQVLAVYEDPYRLYGSDTLLVVDTDYTVAAGRGNVERLSAGVSYGWQTGRRAVKLVYSAGYFTAANVPVEIKGHALTLARQFFKEGETGRASEVASWSGPMGTGSRFAPATISRSIYDALWSGGHVNVEADFTGERDFDLEAA